ncbi:MAG: RnfH family protein [Xanthomonadaceae bacterium]|nr:RnfH family protein [Xanthomonadaceae bacterium]
MAERTIRVEVVYASATGQIILYRAELAQGTTVIQAIDASGITRALAHGTIEPQRLGIHGRRVAPDQLLRDGDRIEIYRPLMLDPMEARRRRAKAG